MTQRKLAYPAAVFLLALWPLAAAAHPMGNFSISHHAAIRAEGDELRIRYRIDFAEIPAVDEMREMGVTKAADITLAVRAAYLAKIVPELIDGLTVTADGQRLRPAAGSSELLMRPGAGGLPTFLITIDLRAPLAGGPGRVAIAYFDENFARRTGWREVVATGSPDWKLIDSDAPTTDASRGLESYPADALAVPPQQTTAHLTFERQQAAGPVTTAPAARAFPPNPPPARPADRFAALMNADRLSASTLALSLAVAFLFGSMHALSPGHGKAMVAAYLVGSRGTPRHAFVLGAVVTVTHTFGVFALGLVVLYASRYVLPERLYPWLGLASGVMIACVGSWQFIRRLARLYTPDLPEEESHDHGPLGGHLRRPPRSADAVTRGGILALGISGGIVPCPSALIVLLSAVALRRIALGLTLIVAFSAGLAAVLIVIGLVVVATRRTLADHVDVKQGWFRSVPIASAAVVAILGAAIAWQAWSSMGLWR